MDENPFASPQGLDEVEIKPQVGPDPTSPQSVPATVVFAMVSCLIAGMLLMVWDDNLSIAGIFTVLLSPITFYPWRIIWYGLLGYFGLLMMACAGLVLGGFLGWTDPQSIATALPAMPFCLTLMLLLALPASQRYFGFEI